MKITNKLIFISAFVFVSVLIFMIYTVASLSDKLPARDTDSEKSTVQTEHNISRPIKDKAIKKQFVIKLEGDLICAYASDDSGNLKLWNSTKRPLLLSDDDLIRLEKGIYTSSFEELCLFFEAYAS